MRVFIGLLLTQIYRVQARHFLVEPRERMESFNLKLHPEKTRQLENLAAMPRHGVAAMGIPTSI